MNIRRIKIVVFMAALASRAKQPMAAEGYMLELFSLLVDRD